MFIAYNLFEIAVEIELLTKTWPCNYVYSANQGSLSGLSCIHFSTRKICIGDVVQLVYMREVNCFHCHVYMQCNCVNKLLSRKY